jgi:DNA helicase-2/ATP-dependent DNA helicase PcrA
VSAAQPLYTALAKQRWDEETGLRIGQRVLHRKFGEGVVLNCEGSGSHARVEVNFKQAGSKWLVLSYANLELI